MTVPDTGLYRASAGKLYVGNGTASDYSGVLIASNVGIGTVTPTATLQVFGSMIVSVTGQTTTPTLYVGTNGNVGVGSTGTALGERLAVKSTLSTASWLASFANTNTEGLYFYHQGSSGGLYAAPANTVIVAADYAAGASYRPLAFATGGAPRLLIDTTGRVGIGWITPSVALEVSGTISATNFVGNGSGLTGITAASSDRIVSGSTSMVAVSTTGFISITQAGTNTGWFDPTRGFVTIGVSSTGPVSATTGYFSSGIASFADPTFGNVHNLDFTNGYYATVKVRNIIGLAIQNGGGVDVPAAGSYNWSVSGGADQSTDTGLSRLGAAKVGVGNSTPGTTNGTLIAASVGVGTITPTATLQVSGTFIVSNSTQVTTPSIYVTRARVTWVLV
jgi:hypothetical protein